MANLIPPMLVEIQLETAKIKQGLTDINSSLNNFGKTVEQQNGVMDKFKSMALGVFGGNLITQGVMGIQSALRGSIKDAQDYERAIAKAGAIIQSTGNVAGVSVGHFQAMANSLEKLGVADENVIMQSENVMATFTQVRNVVGAGNDVFDQATKAALDLSTVMEGDLQASTVQLGKALNDPIKGVGALSKVGVTFTSDQKAMIKTLVESNNVMGAQKIILAEVNREFGGAAKAVGDTFAAAVTRAKDKATDFTRDLIMGLQPILLSIGKTIGDLINKYIKPFVDLLIKNKEAIFAFGIVVGGAIVALYAYKAAMVVVKVAQEAWAVVQALLKGIQLASIASTNGLAASTLALNAAMKANPIGLVVTAIGLLVAGFVIAWNHSETFRKTMIAIGKAGVTAISFIIGIIGDLATAYLKVVTGPMKLFLKGLELLGVKSAGNALKEINGAVDSVGKFFDDAAKKVATYGSALDALEKKKISLPSFGAPKGADTSGGATAPETAGLTKEQIAAAKAKAKAEEAAIKKHADLLTKYSAQVKGIYADMNQAIKDGRDKADEALARRDEQMLTAQGNYDEKTLAIKERYAEKMANADAAYLEATANAYARNAETKEKLETDYNEKILQTQRSAEQKSADIKASGIEKLLAIVEKSRERLRSAWEGGTSFSIKDLFGKDIATQGASELIKGLADKLAATKDLAKKAAELAGAGYSQTFIEQIVKSGPEAGNQMADSLLSLDSATQTSIQKSYQELESLNTNGMDALANTISTSTSFATAELASAYATTQSEISAALIKVNSDLQATLASEKIAYDKAVADANLSLVKALDAADKALKTAQENAKTELDKAMNDASKILADALAKAQTAYQDSIDAIDKATTEKINALKVKLGEVAALLASIGEKQAAASALASAPIYSPGS